MKTRISLLEKCTGLLLILFLITFESFSQTSFKSANKDFEKLSYVEALKSYEDFIGSAKTGHEDLPEAMSKLAFCYKKLHDFTNAERVYRNLFDGY